MNNYLITQDKERSHAEMILFCFAHAGGNSAFFRTWEKLLLPEIQVKAITLPGRGARHKEQPFTKMERLVEQLFCELVAYVDRPFALFGHSLGAAIAYEVTREFCNHNQNPLWLFASARRAPHMPPKQRQIYNLPSNDLLANLNRLNGTPYEVLKDQSLMEALLPSIRADFELNETYALSDLSPLPVSISAFVGNNDPEVNPKEMYAWRDVTSGEFSLRVFEGDHFYLDIGKQDVLASIQHDLRRALAIVY